ncbi:hypothetical protein AOLI_G00300970 [Acnodon oligacanthus]
MEGGTAPGIDGLPVEFYKAFWAELGADLMAILNETLEEGSLPLSCRKAVITQRRETCRTLRTGDGRTVDRVDLVHLTSRLATFRLQFTQKLLTGSVDLVWRKVASVILRKADGFALDATLFLMDYKQLRLSGLPPFYHRLFKFQALFRMNRLEPSNSLFWLLEEPLIKASRLDVTSEGVPGLAQTLCASGMVKLRHLVDELAQDLGMPRLLLPI